MHHFAEFGSRKNMESGTILQEEGKPVQYVYIVENGCLRAHVRIPDTPTLGDEYDLPRESIIGVELLSGSPAQFTAYVPADHKLTVICFDLKAFERLLIMNSKASIDLIQMLYTRWMVPGLTRSRDRSMDGKSSGTHRIDYDDLPDTVKQSNPRLQAVNVDKT